MGSQIGYYKAERMVLIIVLIVALVMIVGCDKQKKPDEPLADNAPRQTNVTEESPARITESIAADPSQEPAKVGHSASPYIHGNPNAAKKGTFKTMLSTNPTTLHVLNYSDAYASTILGYIYENLLERDIETLEFIPLLAKKWEMSEDKMTYTFWLDERAKFQDGKPVTAEDVKFSFDVMHEPTLKGGPRLLSYYSMIDQVSVVDTQTVQVKVKYDHFQNLLMIAGIDIIPKHRYTNQDVNKVMIRDPMGSGAYKLKEWKKKSNILLERDPNYWGKDLPQNVGGINFEKIRFNIIENEKIQLEQLKKGTLDYLSLSPKQWEMESSDPPFGTTITKLEYSNKSPKGYGYVGWRLTHPLFTDKKVRRALGYLIDREEIIRKIYFAKYAKTLGIFYHKSEYNSPNVVPIAYDPAQAQKLFKEAGWEDHDQDFVLDKDGKKMSFTVLTANPQTASEILPLMQESWKKGGVEIKIQQLDFTTLLKLIDEQNFDAVMLGWTRSVDPDPTQLWHSQYAVPGGQNFVYFKNQRVDKILDAIKFTIPHEKRVAYYQELHEILYEEQPYLFLWEQDKSFIAVQKEIQRPKDYYEYGLGSGYWWVP